MTDCTTTSDAVSDSPSKSFIIKYPIVKEYIYSTADISPLFCKLLSIILYLRTQLGFTVLESEPFFDKIILVDSTVFQNIESEDLHKILSYVIAVASIVIDSHDDFAEEDRIKIIDRLLSYKK
jgi:hypothetical protein